MILDLVALSGSPTNLSRRFNTQMENSAFEHALHHHDCR